MALPCLLPHVQRERDTNNKKPLFSQLHPSVTEQIKYCSAKGTCLTEQNSCPWLLFLFGWSGEGVQWEMCVPRRDAAQHDQPGKSSNSVNVRTLWDEGTIFFGVQPLVLILTPGNWSQTSAMQRLCLGLFLINFHISSSRGKTRQI